MLKDYHIQVGEVLLIASGRIIVNMSKGSACICLFSKEEGIGGVACYERSSIGKSFSEADALKFGEIAFETLIAEIVSQRGEKALSKLKAKIIGAGTQAQENVLLARKLLKKYHISVVSEESEGNGQKKMILSAPEGRVQVESKSPSLKLADSSSKSSAVKDPVKPVASSQPSFASSVASATLRSVTAKPGHTAVTVLPFSKGKRKVLIVDDSRPIRELLKKILEEDPDFEIIGQAVTPIEAQKIVDKERPDVITLDIHMPEMTGVEWLEKLLPTNPIPVVMISTLQFKEGNEVFKALELGAIDYIQKPNFSELPIVAPIIREKVKQASYAQVLSTSDYKQHSSDTVSSSDRIDFTRILAIGASTGGTEAIKAVLTKFPEKIPPVVIVQHIPQEFSGAFAERLNSLCPFEVKEAQDGDEVIPSRVLIAPGGKQMKVEKSKTGFVVRLTNDNAVNRHKPSVDYLFDSVAMNVGKNSVGVILTGMGADGAHGLLSMKRAGSKTLGQDEKSCVVYGMPKVAFEAGAVEKVVSLDKMPREIFNLLSR